MLNNNINNHNKPAQLVQTVFGGNNAQNTTTNLGNTGNAGGANMFAGVFGNKTGQNNQ